MFKLKNLFLILMISFSISWEAFSIENKCESIFQSSTLKDLYNKSKSSKVAENLSLSNRIINNLLLKVFILNSSLIVGANINSEYHSVNLEQYLNEIQNENSQVDWVDLVNETAPFPHLALRINNEIFSYGVDQFSVSPANIYLTEHLRSNKQGVLSYISSKMPRKMQIIRLKIDPKNKLQLRTYLINQTSKNYKNITHVNDCAVMIARALNRYSNIKIPIMIDTSPTQVFTYFSIHNSIFRNSKNAQVLKIFNVNTSLNDSKMNFNSMQRTISINEIESFLWTMSLPLNSLLRIYFDLKLRSDNDIQKHNKAVLESHDQFKKQVIAELEDKPSYLFFQKILEQFQFQNSIGYLNQNNNLLNKCPINSQFEIDYLIDLANELSEEIQVIQSKLQNNYYDIIRLEVISNELLKVSKMLTFCQNNN